MRTRVLIRLTVLFSFGVFATNAWAASVNEFKATYAKAEAANAQAIAMKNAWTTTAKELKAAKKVAAAGKYEDAVKLAEKAQALAKLSIAQAKEQARIWPEAVIH